MVHLALPGHSRARVDLDHCRPCGLVWFDALESVHLSGLGWVRLLRELQLGMTTAGMGSTAVVPAPGAFMSDAAGDLRPRECPLCKATLKSVHNRTRFGRFPALECPGCGGHLHGQAGLLAERGLVRPLLPTERRALREERRELCCLGCGAPSDGTAETCRYCASPLLMIDLPRLSHALRLHAGMADEPTPADGRPLAWACRGCGMALDPSRDTQCPQCRHVVVVPSLLDLLPLLDGLEREWLDRQALQGQARLTRQADYRVPLNADARATLRAGKRRRGWQETALARLMRGWGETSLEGFEGDPPSLRDVLLVLAIFALIFWMVS